MTDLELTKACAEAMGAESACTGIGWRPLTNDAQAMALVKRFRLKCCSRDRDTTWEVWGGWKNRDSKEAYSPDLNRAICECVARLTRGPNER